MNWENINKLAGFIFGNLVKKPVQWVVYKGLNAEETRDNEWVVTIVSTFLIVFFLFWLGYLIKRAICFIISRLTWKKPREKQRREQAEHLPKSQPFSEKETLTK